MKRGTSNNYGKAVGTGDDCPSQYKLSGHPTQKDYGMQIGFCVRGLSSNAASITIGFWAL